MRQYCEKHNYLRKNCKDCKEQRNKYMREWRKKNPTKASFYSRRYAWTNKLKVIKMLGGKCVKCGIDDPRILTINHRKCDGNKERKKLENKSGYLDGKIFYRKILQGEIPLDDVELRCYNCNILYEYKMGRRKIPRDLIEKGDKN